MNDIVSMNYDEVEAMERTIRNSADRLSDLMSDIEQIAAQIDNGVLLGAGGEALSDAFRSQMNSGIDRLKEKFIEVADDIKFNMELFNASDNNVKSKF